MKLDKKFMERMVYEVSKMDTDEIVVTTREEIPSAIVGMLIENGFVVKAVACIAYKNKEGDLIVGGITNILSPRDDEDEDEEGKSKKNKIKIVTKSSDEIH
jgi:phosphoribosylformylglycinamidine (FGAM) synthase-like enzyme